MKGGETMSLQMRMGSIHAPAISRQQTFYPGQRPGMGQRSGRDEVKGLQLRQQQLQNTMLLMKASGSDSSSLPEETQKILEREMDKVNLELKAAKADETRISTSNAAGLLHLQKKESATALPADRFQRPCKDVYEKENGRLDAPGIYKIEGTEKGYGISFIPYSS